MNDKKDDTVWQNQYQEMSGTTRMTKIFETEDNIVRDILLSDKEY